MSPRCSGRFHLNWARAPHPNESTLKMDSPHFFLTRGLEKCVGRYSPARCFSSFATYIACHLGGWVTK